MPANYFAQTRYRVINRCLSNRFKRFWTCDEIRSKLEDADIFICKRTLEKDFDAMRHDDRLGFHAPIVYCRTNQGYYYSLDGYSIDHSRLTEDELESLNLGIMFMPH